MNQEIWLYQLTTSTNSKFSVSGLSKLSLRFLSFALWVDFRFFFLGSATFDIVSSQTRISLSATEITLRDSTYGLHSMKLFSSTCQERWWQMSLLISSALP